MQWDHLLECPPQYIDTAYDVIVNDSDDVIVLGSQLSSEVHCFQLNINSGTIPPQIKAPYGKHQSQGKCILKPRDYMHVE